MLNTLVKNEALGQISASTSAGCVPLTEVIFSTSYDNPQNINWSFGDGATASISQPKHTFATPGNYSVIFSAVVNGNPVNDTLLIQVYPKPIAAFTIVNPTGCSGDAISFSDLSTGGNGSAIVSWNWTFGDGGVNTENTAIPSYTYSSPGIYNVGLAITDGNNCSSTLTQNGVVSVSSPPTISIQTNPNPPNNCTAPFTVSFSSTATSHSPVSNSLTYQWNFGNGQQSTAANPGAINYIEEGDYTVTLTVTDDNLCSSQKTIAVSATQPHANFSIVGAENDTVCSAVNFINQSFGSILSIAYGDGSSGVALSHTYNTEGWYDITMTVGSGACADDTTLAVFVQIPSVSITAAQDTVCGIPADFQLTAVSNHPLSAYTWTLPSGDQQSSNATITATVQAYTETEFSINKPQSANVSLNVTSSDGCAASASKTLYVVKPNALFFPDLLEGCAPLSLVFSDSSTTSYGEITSWKWNFADGSSALNANDENDVTHIYTTPGTYYPFLVVTTSDGCIDTSFTHTVHVGSVPPLAFSINPSTVCPGEPVQLTYLPSPADSVDTWHYSGDTGLLFSCSGTPSPTVTFSGEAATSEVTLTGGFNGCYNTTTQTITVNGPIGRIEYSCNCDTPMDYPFTAITSNATSWDWNFGDGTVITQSTATSINHTYTASGNYWAVLKSYNDASGCPPFLDSILVRVRNVKAGLDIPDHVCAGVSSSLSAAPSVDVAGAADGCFKSHLWYFNDTTRPKISSGPSINHTFTPIGYHTIELFVEDVNGCVDSTSAQIYVSGVQSALTLNPNSGCLPLAINFNDASQSDTTITTWSWNFGDTGTSQLQNPSHTYSYANFDAGENVVPFNGTLTVTTVLGCTAQSSFVATPIVPKATFQSVGSATICEGTTLSFVPTGSPQNGHTFNWDFGDGQTGSGFNVSHTYPDSGSYTVSLTVTNSLGCQNTKTVNNYVKVQKYPEAGFTSSVDLNSSVCYPALVTFTDTSIVNPFGSRVWSLGNGVPAIGNATIGTTYSLPGTYSISLIEKTTFGCADTAKAQIVVVGPVGHFNIYPTPVCRGESVTLSITDTTDVMTWQWDFGDGQNISEGYEVVHGYDFSFNPPTNQTIVSLVLWNADSVCSHVETGTVSFFDVHANFLRNLELTAADSIHCYGLTDQFFNASSPPVNYWSWDFGNGQTYLGANPPNQNYSPGTYTVTLAVSATPPGCVDTVSKTMVILPLPQAITSDQQMCWGENIQLHASGGVTYSWSPTDGLDNPLAQNPTASPTETTTYTVVITDANTCSSSADAVVTVFEPYPSFDISDTLIIGEEYTLDASYGNGYTYQWSPDVWVSCTTCPNPIFQPLENTEYTLLVSDILGCFSEVSRLEIIVLALSSVDVPDAFTPNGDGINDVVYVKGWGIESLLSFQIFNRWGEMVFETTDVEQGWDGYYKGKLQPADTYSYLVQAKPYIADKPLVKSGFINILR